MIQLPRFRALVIIFLLALAFVCHAAAAASAGDTLSESEVAIRQAHMDLAAYTCEVGMDAAIGYIYPLRMTDTTRLNELLSDFRGQESLIASATTKGDFDNLTSAMRSITAEFRNETDIQMENGYGNWDDLKIAVGAATAGNPYIDQREAAYWNVRRAGQLADYDSWVSSTQASLDDLKLQGYDMAKAQRTLDVLGSKRPDLASALEAESEEQIVSANNVIMPLSEELLQQVEDATGEVSEAERMQFYIDQGYRVVYRADLLNRELTRILLDIGPAETTTRNIKVNLANAQRILDTNNLGATEAPLRLIKKDLKELSMNYRDIASTAALPADLSATLKALVITLDNTADQMGDY